MIPTLASSIVARSSSAANQDRRRVRKLRNLPGRAGHHERFNALPKLTQPHVRMLTVSRRDADPVQDRRDLQNLAPGLEKVVIENLHCITPFLHEIHPQP